MWRSTTIILVVGMGIAAFLLLTKFSVLGAIILAAATMIFAAWNDVRVDRLYCQSESQEED